MRIIFETKNVFGEKIYYQEWDKNWNVISWCSEISIAKDYVWYDPNWILMFIKLSIKFKSDIKIKKVIPLKIDIKSHFN